jgi:hypothetical protein
MMQEVRLGSACESAGVHAMAGEIATIEPIIDEGICRSRPHVQQHPGQYSNLERKFSSWYQNTTSMRII